MAYPQGFLFQPSVSLALQCPTFGSGVVLGPRTEELGRSSSGSAFAPYSGSGFNSHLPFGGEPRAAGTLNSFVSPGYDPSSSLSGSLDYHPFGPLGPYPYGDPTYRKNATRDATATLKAWLNEHRKNPYPTKGEKIMLAIITKMTLTQVSTWFANARRRLKKENKMTWTPRNRSEDEEEEDIDLERNEEEEPMKMNADETENVTRRALDSCVLAFRDDSDVDRGFSDPDSGDQRLAHQPGPTPVSEAPPQNRALNLLRVSESSLSPPPKEHVDSCGATQGPNSGPKPKLWSLAEIATSDKSKGGIDFSQSGLAVQNPFYHGTTLTRHLYYTSPFIPGYSSFGPLGPLHGAGSHLNGLQQKILQRAEAAARDCRFPNQNQNQNQLELHEVKRGMTNV